MAMMEMASRMMMNNDDDDADDLFCAANPTYAQSSSPPSIPQPQQQMAMNAAPNAFRLPQQQPQPPQPPQPQQTMDLLKGVQDATLKVRLKHLVDLLVASEASRSSKAPRSFFVDRASYVGEARRDAAQLRCSLTVSQLQDGWACQPLFTAALAVTSSSVKFAAKAPMKSATTAGNADLERILGSAEFGRDGLFCVVGEWLCLVGARAGVYSVDLELLVPYATPMKTGLHCSIPRATLNDLRFSVPQRGVLVKVDPALFTVTEENIAKDEVTTVKCTLPPTTSLAVNWTLVLAEVKERAKETVSASVEQCTLCTLGEASLVSNTTLKYKIISGQASVFVVEVDPRVRVIHVEGTKAVPVRNWEVEKRGPCSFVDPDEPAQQPQGQFLRVWLEYGLEDAYELTVVSELPLDSGLRTVRVPNFACVAACDAHQITREKGFVSIEARTNVEVKESGLPRRLNRVDASELPETLYDKTGTPPLLAAKFLAPNYVWSIAITKHSDASVLIAAVDNAHFVATCSPDGLVMHRLVLVVRNTQRQFLRVACGKGSEIWSAFVAGEPVRPATDRDEFVMIPLKKSGSPQSRESGEFTVELTYMSTVPRMEAHGEIAVEFASVDLPISHLFVSVYLPEGYEYKEFEGNIRQVKYFSQNPPEATASNNRQQQQQQQQQQRMLNRKDSSSEMESKAYFSKKPFAEFTSIGAAKSVSVALPTTSKDALFEQLLVMASDARLHVEVPYRKLMKSCFFKRHISPCGVFMSYLGQWACCCCIRCCCKPSDYDI